MPTLYILCGVPGCGKSTFATKITTHYYEKDIRYVSRDDIRFSILKDGEEYFSHEKEVFKKFANTITQILVDGFDVIADATHLNKFSRAKLLNAIGDNVAYKVIFIYFDTPLRECFRRNSLREQNKIVPEDVICKMWNSFEVPSIYENKKCIGTLMVRSDSSE